MHSGITTDDAMNLAMSAKAVPLYEAVIEFINTEIEPRTEEYFRLGEGRTNRWAYGPGQLELLDSLKAKAKARGLWNFFLPNAETGEGLSNLDYAYIAAELGKNPIASECMNCSAPDTGNMEVLERVGTPEQKARWLGPLMRGEIRSAFAMTEPAPGVGSDPRMLSTLAERAGDDWIINGHKWFSSGAIGAALTLGVRGGGVLQSLLLLPLYVPVLVFGTGAVDAQMRGLGAEAHLSVLLALLCGSAALGPWACAAALRLALE